jgi:hypothetical protein
MVGESPPSLARDQISSASPAAAGAAYRCLGAKSLDAKTTTGGQPNASPEDIAHTPGRPLATTLRSYSTTVTCRKQ